MPAQRCAVHTSSRHELVLPKKKKFMSLPWPLLALVELINDLITQPHLAHGSSAVPLLRPSHLLSCPQIRIPHRRRQEQFPAVQIPVDRFWGELSLSFEEPSQLDAFLHFLASRSRLCLFAFTRQHPGLD